MALYKYPSLLQESNSVAFDQVHQPGASAPYGGLYRCTGCGHEIAIAKFHVLPPQNDHQHSTYQPIRWQLVVAHA
jgi:hypothetical protein